MSSAPRLLTVLKQARQTVSFCESLTAGLAAATFADTPGASAALQGGLVTYATQLKVELAGVAREVVDKHGVVSAQCAEAMAAGTRERCASDWAVSLTGVAGPDPQDAHPVAEVWIGVAGPDGIVESIEAFTEEERLDLTELVGKNATRGRTQIRIAAVERCFQILISRVSQHLESI